MWLTWKFQLFINLNCSVNFCRWQNWSTFPCIVAWLHSSVGIFKTSFLCWKSKFLICFLFTNETIYLCIVMYWLSITINVNACVSACVCSSEIFSKKNIARRTTRFHRKYLYIWSLTPGSQFFDFVIYFLCDVQCSGPIFPLFVNGIRFQCYSPI